MSYLALARKWRPRTFSQMLGQEPVNKALTNALTQQRLHHAYLFTGTRGVGKTSVARILAKALNCEQGISAEPCLRCDTCIAIEQGRFIDLIEIDGASKTRVEDTRDLLENVHYAPASGRYKIYLIDEVHMLSQHSFNALLKTLEEPPAHVKFILATTDPQKVPVTVLSRCLQFNLKHLSAELIAKHLAYILQDEHLDFEPQALTILAKAARGSMRDALSLLDQAITSCDKKLQAEDVNLLLGYTQQDYAIQLLQALAAQNPSMLLQLSQQIAAEGEHFYYVIDELLTYLHHITLFQSIGDTNPLISPIEAVKTLAQEFSPEDVQLFYQIALKGREELHLAPTLSIGFNMTVLRMLTFRPAPRQKTPQSARQEPSQSPRQEAPQSPRQEAPQSLRPAASPRDPENVDSSRGLAEGRSDLNYHEKSEAWADIIPQLKLSGFALTAAENTEFVSKEQQRVTLRVAKGHQSLFSQTTISRLEAGLSEYYQSPIKIMLESKDSVQDSPAQQKTQAIQEKQQHAEAALLQDPLFQQIKQDFSAELVKNSIVPLKDDL
ncbi:MAG: DNA polymerase III subunit gamma/tau [Legionella sp.]|jgi:DNA polymerase-3 subunit gamma/tau